MSKHRQWYVKFEDGRVVGPISSSQLKKLAATGKIGPETPISLDGYKWYPASHVKGLTYSKPSDEHRVTVASQTQVASSRSASTTPKASARSTEDAPKILNILSIKYVSFLASLLCVTCIVLFLVLHAGSNIRQLGKIKVKNNRASIHSLLHSLLHSLMFLDSTRLAAHVDYDVHIIDWKNENTIATFPHQSQPSPSFRVKTFDLTEDGQFSVTLHEGITVWNVATQKAVFTVSASALTQSSNRQEVGYPLAVAFCNGDQDLLQVGTKGFCVWDMHRKKVITSVSYSIGETNEILIAPRPGFVAIHGVGDSGRVDLWELPKALNRGSVNDKSDGIMAAAISRDGSRLAIVNYENESASAEDWQRAQKEAARIGSYVGGVWIHRTKDLRLLDVGEGIELISWPIDDVNQVSSVALSNDGDILAMSTENGLRFYGASLATFISIETEEGSLVEYLAFSPDNRMLAAGHYDGEIVLWDVSAVTKSRNLNRVRS